MYFYNIVSNTKLFHGIFEIEDNESWQRSWAMLVALLPTFQNL